MGSLVVLLLAERARSEDARSTRAFEDRLGCPVKSEAIKLGRDGRSSQVPFLRAVKSSLGHSSKER